MNEIVAHLQDKKLTKDIYRKWLIRQLDAHYRISKDLNLDGQNPVKSASIILRVQGQIESTMKQIYELDKDNI